MLCFNLSTRTVWALGIGRTLLAGLLAAGLAITLARPTRAAESETPAAGAEGIEAADAAEQADKPADKPKLFARQKVDAGQLRFDGDGVLVVKFGEIGRHPRLGPLFALARGQLSAAICSAVGLPKGAFDADKLEWVAITGKAKAMVRVGDRKTDFGLGVSGDRFVARLKPGNWHEHIVSHAPNAKLRDADGKPYLLISKAEAFTERAACLRWQ